ncbi:CRISPR-associated endonuclease Cas1 [Erysipelotrichaceae bacterium]|nr:CRISPR-associated endonuclease Cas1 [Erysipelotrichaceae bacterium]
MGYRQVLIAGAAGIRSADNQLIVEQKGNKNRIPLEDINIIILESREITLTSFALAECARFNIIVLCCDGKFMPVMQTHALNQHYRPHEVFLLQQNQTSEMKERATECLLKGKLANQLAVLKYCQLSPDARTLLEKYYQELTGHDTQNREGTAAKVFFYALHGKEFLRFEGDYENSILNYGYSILRASISRSLTSYGFTLHMGVNHRSKTNALNLTYDLIEPFRALIDYYLFCNRDNLQKQLTLQHRKELIYLLNAPVLVNGKSYTVSHAIELLVRSYLNYLENGELHFALPELVTINFDTFFEPL